MATNEITQVIGSIEKFGFLLEDGVNVPEQDILLGGPIDETGEAEQPHYLVTSAWEQDGSVVVNASKQMTQAQQKWIVTESESGEVRVEPYAPEERVESDVWYSFYASEKEVAQVALRRLSENPGLWMKDYMRDEVNVASAR